jgi:hypothetical protein
MEKNFVPVQIPTYVPFGFYPKLFKIIETCQFYPVYITGLSGNGKTMMVEQVCAALSRELIRVNITKRTDESDLIGTYELVDGNTLRKEGPVITAMKRGAVLLLDETDLGTEDLLCLQPILEGKPYFDKKTGEVVHPKKGFNIIATANTKGKGNDDGRFIGANVLNEAFLERFAITVEQMYPEPEVETEILLKKMNEFELNEQTFVSNLVKWANVIRKSFFDGAVDDIVSTRRLVHIVQTFFMFNDKHESIKLCLNRFDDETKIAFLDLYSKIDSGLDASSQFSIIQEYKELASNLSGYYNTEVGIYLDNLTQEIVIESHSGKVTRIASEIAKTMEKFDQHIISIVEKHSNS